MCDAHGAGCFEGTTRTPLITGAAPLPGCGADMRSLRASAPVASSAGWTNTRDMKIGAAAHASGLTIKAIRHYESVGLLRNVPRSGAYREFSSRDVDTLRLAAHCRGLGFSVAETKEVLALVKASEPDCPSPRQMNAIVENKLRRIRGEIRELERKARELEKVRTYVQKRLLGA
jgi:DNA-binding transcriptional MerR regulator